MNQANVQISENKLRGRVIADRTHNLCFWVKTFFDKLRYTSVPIDATLFFTLVSANDTTVHLIGQIVETGPVAVAAPIIQSLTMTNQSVVVAAENATARSQLLVSPI